MFLECPFTVVVPKPCWSWTKTFSHVKTFNICLPLTATSGKVFLPICSRCWTCVWRSRNKGSSAHSMSTWALPCWSGNIRGSASSPDHKKSTHIVAEEEDADMATQPMSNLPQILHKLTHSLCVRGPSGLACYVWPRVLSGFSLVSSHFMF